MIARIIARVRGPAVFFGCLLLLAGAGCEQLPYLAPTPVSPVATATLAPSLPPTPEPYSGVGFDAFLAELESSLLRDRPDLVGRYLARLPTAPLTDGNRAIFLRRGVATSVAVVGDMNNWDAAQGLALRRIDGTDLWVGEGDFASDARLDYKFLIDGSHMELDPLNSRTIRASLGPNSELAMPAYVTPPELEPAAQPAEGALTGHTLDSVFLSQTRTFFVYTPASELLGEPPPTVIIHDGGEYISLIDATAILDRLIADGDIPPLVAVFVPPVIRDEEYVHNKAYVQFLADELIPFIQQTYGTAPEASKTANLGASLGGLLAVYAGVSRPDRFGLAAGYSGLYSLENDALIRSLQQQETLPLRFYLNVGSYETAVGGNLAEGNLLEANRRLAETLAARFYDFSYVEAPQGHSWGLWRDYLGDGLRFLFPR